MITSYFKRKILFWNNNRIHYNQYKCKTYNSFSWNTDNNTLMH